MTPPPLPPGAVLDPPVDRSPPEPPVGASLDRAPTNIAKPTDAPEKAPLSAGSRFMEGFKDPLYGAAQLGAHISPEASPGQNPALEAPGIGPVSSGLPPEIRVAVDKAVKDREKRIKRGEPDDGIDWARMAGKAANPLPYIGGLVGGIPGAIAGAAFSGLTDPVTNPGNSFGAQKTGQTLFSAAFGGTAGLATKALGWGVAPTVHEAAQYLIDKGIKLTPGQIFGAISRRAEEAARSFPILGTFIRGAEQRTMQSFNRAAIDHALSPISVKLPESTAMGHEAMSYAKLRLEDAYSALLPKMQLSLTTKLSSDIANIRFMSSELPEAQAKQFETILHNRLGKHFIDTGSVSGQKLKQIEMDLNQLSSQYRSSADGAQRELAHLLTETKLAVHDALAEQNPAAAESLKKINTSYAMFARLESAASARKEGAGVFTPSDLLGAIKQGDKSVRKGQFARGDALMQDFAEYASEVLTPHLRDSGSPERAMWLYDLGALGVGAWHPAVPATLIGASAPWTKPGQAVVDKIAQPGPMRRSIGEMVGKASPFSGTAAPNLMPANPMTDNDLR